MHGGEITAIRSSCDDTAKTYKRSERMLPREASGRTRRRSVVLMSDPDTDHDPATEAISEPSFAIPQQPERRYSRGGSLSYEGTTVFALTPDSVPIGTDPVPTERANGGGADVVDRDAWLRGLVERVLGTDRYTYGDWFDLPMPVFLVHDRETGDVFRVAVRGGNVELHVLPETESGGLYALYERLCAATADGTWRVTCRTDADR